MKNGEHVVKLVSNASQLAKSAAMRNVDHACHVNSADRSKKPELSVGLRRMRVVTDR